MKLGHTIDNLVDALKRLPGIGPRSAQRIAFHLLQHDRDGALRALQSSPNLVLSYEALSDGLTADQIVMRVLQAIPAPDKPLEAHVRVAAAS